MNITDKKIGIVGGGQLGKMMILEAKRLGFYVAVLDPANDCPASSICDKLLPYSFDDEQGYRALADLVGKSGVITYEFEHINALALEALERDGYIIYPSVTSLKTIQNKFTQKTVLKQQGILVPEFEKVCNVEQVKELSKAFGYPIMLKAATGGYDGKGNALIRSEAEIEAAFEQLGNCELMAERFIDFKKEISVIACRGIDGRSVVYPTAENIHNNSILDTTLVPARISQSERETAMDIADKVMQVFEGVGAFCVEMFVGGDGQIYVNEVAPRPHNSGHYTIEGCFASQFENHVRAITGLPLGDARLIQPTVMVNLLGQSDGRAKLLGVYEAYKKCATLNIHFYGKSESKVGRKMGHYTIIEQSSLDNAIKLAADLKNIIKIYGD